MTAANRHDVSQIEAVLDGIKVERPNPPLRRAGRHKHLCADAGYTGAPTLKVIEEHGYIPHVKGRGQEACEIKRDPEQKPDAGLSKSRTAGSIGFANYW